MSLVVNFVNRLIHWFQLCRPSPQIGNGGLPSVSLPTLLLLRCFTVLSLISSELKLAPLKHLTQNVLFRFCFFKYHLFYSWLCLESWWSDAAIWKMLSPVSVRKQMWWHDSLKTVPWMWEDNLSISKDIINKRKIIC